MPFAKDSSASRALPSSEGSAGALEFAELTPTDQSCISASDEVAERRIAAQVRVVLDPSGPVGARSAQLIAVDRGMETDLGDSGLELEEQPLDTPLCTRWAHDDPVGEHCALFGGETPEREPGDTLTFTVAEPHRKTELDRELEVDVEEIGPLLECAEMAVDMAHVEAPHDGALDLRAALSPDLVEIGVVPRVLDGARETAVAVEEAG